MQITLKRSIHLALFCVLLSSSNVSHAQAGDCPYPILFLHGWTGNHTSWAALFNNPDFAGIWGGVSDTIWTVNNAYSYTKAQGPDNVFYNNDDDVLTQFVNETNTLAPGCIYVIDFDNYWNQNTANPSITKGGGPGFFSNESDSNEAALRKAGPAVRSAINKILAANPSKKKVILAGYSMGGLVAREYLQRKNGTARQWWVSPTLADGHKVAKVFTVGTPHRGSNTLGNSLEDDQADDRNGLPDLLSEAVRDMRYSYACGFLNLYNCPGIYLFGGNENDLGNYYRNNDVDCNGNGTSTNVPGINISGKTQFGTSYNEWDGTYDNPNHALPTNVRYTYYVANLFNVGCSAAYPGYGCGGDGVVDDERQWIYAGGNGKTDNYLSGASVPRPTDGVNFRLSDRIASTNRVTHLGEVGDTEFVVRGFDEGDYANYAWDINQSVWYAGMAQIRPEKTPTNSELTNTGNRNIDGDWFKFTATGTAKNYRLEVIPQPQMDVRVDFYTTAPNLTTNANAPLFSFKAAGTSNLITLLSPLLSAGTYYFRITHWTNTAPVPKNGWKLPYKYRVMQVIAPLAGNDPEELGNTFEVADIYPQPVRNELNINIFSQLDNQKTDITMFNSIGKAVRVQTEVLRDGENQLSLDISALESGFYVLNIQAGQTSKVFKIIKD